MRNLILHNWKAKLACLGLAAALWYLIQENIPKETTWTLQPPAVWSQP